VKSAIIAPQVAAVIAEYSRGSSTATQELIGELSEMQLRGQAFLPDPLPATPAMSNTVNLEELTTSERRLVLIAALSVTDSISQLLSAAAIDTDSVLSPRVTDFLSFGDGRFRIIEKRVRSVVLTSASPVENAEAHWALAHAHRTGGQPAIAAWHSALGDPGEREDRAAFLLALAERRAAYGDFATSFEIAQLAAKSSSGGLSARASLCAARSALWCGWLSDAEEHGRRAGARSSEAAAGGPAALLRAVEILREGPAESLDIKSKIIGQMQPLAEVAITRADRSAITQLIEISSTFQQGNYEEADSIQARLLLGLLPARGRWPWSSAPGALSPLAEAHVRLQQVAFQLQADDFLGAANTLHDASTRLPLADAGAGIVSSYVRIVAPAMPHINVELADVYDTLSAKHPIAYELFGFSMGERSAAAGILARSGKQSESTSTPNLWSALLSPREREVAYLVTRGHSNYEIAHQLTLSVRTVEVHLGRVFRKMAVKSRTELVARALRPLRS
jgi:DNA-binding CsgD family transcriptional regulator